MGPTSLCWLVDWMSRNNIAAAGRPASVGSEALCALGAGLAGPERYGAVDRHCDRGGRRYPGRLRGPDKAWRR